MDCINNMPNTYVQPFDTKPKMFLLMSNNVRQIGEARQADLVGTHCLEKSCQREGKLYSSGHMIIGKDPGESAGFERPWAEKRGQSQQDGTGCGVKEPLRSSGKLHSPNSLWLIFLWQMVNRLSFWT